MAMKLTKAMVDRIALPAGKSDAIVWDSDLPGFGLRLRAGGSRVWIVQYRVESSQRRESIGRADRVTVDEARKAAKRLLARVELGHDPVAEEREQAARRAETFGRFVDRFLAFKRKKLRPKSFTELERHLRRDAKPLHDRPLHAIKRAHIADLISELAETAGAPTADCCRTSLSSFFVWLMREGISEANPVIGVVRHHTYRARDRVLSDGELKAIWQALPADRPDGTPADFAAIVKLLILTGQRREEIAALRWSEIDLQRAVITLPAARTKNHREHVVPLSEPALAILRRVPRRDGRDHLFGRVDSVDGFNGWHWSKHALDAKAKIAAWTLHDLRRSMVTKMAEELYILPHVIEAVVNHASGHKAGVAGVYNRAIYARDARAALDRWAEYLMSVVSGEASKVVAYALWREPCGAA
jgi:integrase